MADLGSRSCALLEEQLDSFDADIRCEALTELARRIGSGDVSVPAPRPEVNLHFHTFFSFNANGWSPSRISWEARKHGLCVAGIVDFDVLDGMEEFLAAGELIGQPTTAALETRVFIQDYMGHVISSPNEPGIAYFMAAGCFKTPQHGSKAAHILDSMREMARRRNVEVMNRVNRYLDTVQIDYEVDVLPLTPSGNATERHLLAAYDAKAREVYEDGEQLEDFWGNALGISESEAERLLSDPPALHEKVRSKLMKYGGVGYVPPSGESFPRIELVIEMIRGMDALPTATWLDGTNSGEENTPAMLDLLAAKGVVAMNMIPDRNWNVRDPDEKRLKLAKLEEAVAAAREVDFPLCIGTEMNKLGMPFVDNFAAPELQPYLDDFLEGAFFFWGHTCLARYADMGYASRWSQAYLGTERAPKNRFYAKIGRLADPTTAKQALAGMDPQSATPDDVIRALCDREVPSC